jgi:HEAT repeat protein
LTEEEVREIRGRLGDFEFNRESYGVLVKMGPKAFPVYETILADPKSDPDSVTRIFSVLAAVDADRSRFVEPAVQRLADPEWGVRLSAVKCLAKIGSSRDGAPIVVLLADENPLVVFAAAKTLVAIGDRRTLAAMDVWLNSGVNRHDHADLRRHVAKCRDELKQRLDKEAKEKPPGK